MTGGVLITGAGTGLGLEMACSLAASGFNVYAGVLDSSQCQHVEAQAAARNVKLETLRLDVTDQQSIETAVRTVVEQTGGIYGLVNNAGISLRGYFEDLDEGEIRQTFEVNLFGTMAVTRAVLPYMRQARDGRLVFISSIGGHIGAMARTAYCASKFAVEGFAESLMQEVTPLGVKVSIVAPAIVKTERWTTNRGIARRASDPSSPYYDWFQGEEKLADMLVRTSPTTPADVAAAVGQALSVQRPRLRYLVGSRARLLLALRRYIPGELFERLYFGEIIRRVTGSRPRGRMFLGEQSSASAALDEAHTRKGDLNMPSLFRIVKVLGLGHTLRANRAKRLSEETIRGFYSTRAIIALLNVGLLDELEAQKTVNLAAFAEKQKLDLHVLKALCDYLFSLRILHREGENYSLAPKGKLATQTMRGAFTIAYAYEDVFYNLEALLKREKQYGVDVNRRGEFVATGSGAVGKLLAFPMVADTLQRNQFERVLDLGCGDGAFLRDLVTRNRGVTGYGVDLSPEGVAAGRRQVEQAQLQDKVHLLVGDMFNIDAVAPQMGRIDAATCVYVLHEFLTASRERTVELLRKFKSTFPGVPLVICEVIRHTAEEMRRKPGGIMEIQIFHALSNQALFSRDEWKSVFNEAGFNNVNEDYLSYARTAIFTVS